LDSADLAALASFASGLQFIDGAANDFRQLAKRWDNRLVLEGFSLSELYLDGRIAIALVVDVGLCADPGFSRYLGHGPIGRGDSHKHKDSTRGRTRRVILLILSDSDNEMSGFGERRDKQPMLIHSVKTIEGKKSRISPGLIWFYDISNFQREIGRDSLYKSVLWGIYEGLPRIVQREVSEGRIIYPASDNDRGGNVVKGCAEIVDSVSDDGRDIFREADRALHMDCMAIASGILILVGHNGIDVSLDQIAEPRFKLLDVLVGPFDL
jgi:hypothetical protein